MTHHPLADCTRCPLRDTHTYVPTSHGTGPVAIVGAYPGWAEVRAGVPMVGKSGTLLGQLIERADAGELLAQSTVTNAIACQPPEDSRRLALAIECCRPRLLDEIKDAREILALGGEAGRAVTGRHFKITDSPHVTHDEGGRRVVVGPNPAAVLRNPNWSGRLQGAIERMKTADVSVTWEWPPYESITTEDEAEKALTYLRSPGLVIDTEYVGDTKWDRFHVERLRCLGVGPPDQKIRVFGERVLTSPWVQDALTRLFTTWGADGHNIKGDAGVLGRRGIKVRITGDTMMAAVVLDERPGARGLAALCSRYQGLPDWKPKGAADEKSKWYRECSDEDLHRYNAMDVAATTATKNYFKARGAWDHPLHRDLLVPACEFLRGVEDYGIGVDDTVLAPMVEAYEETEEKRKRLVIDAFEGVLDHPLNPNAPHQVKEALRRVGVDLEDTNKETLRDLIDDAGTHPEVVDALTRLLAYRKVNKALSTYLRPLFGRETRDRRVHAEFNPAGTETGRLACARPNMQNWPRSDQPMLEGLPNVRSAFWAGEGRVFVKVDLSQAELRVIAVESGDVALLEICADPDADLHTEVAQRIGRPRVQAKAINFGLPFGLSVYGLQRILGLSESESHALVRDHRDRFPGVWAWQDEVRAKIKAGEHLTTVFGRTRRPLDVELLDERQRAEAEREILAFPSQAVVSDITLRAAIEAARQGVQVVNLVHDEIRAECDAATAGDVARILSESVRLAGLRYSQQVDFPVETKTTTHWT